MKAIFLTETYVRALKGLGVELVSTSNITDICDRLSLSDKEIITTMSERLFNHPMMAPAGLSLGMKLPEDEVACMPNYGDVENPLDVFFVEGELCEQDTSNRIRLLNSVVLGQDLLVLYEDPSNETPVYEGMTRALSKVMSLTNMMKTKIWSHHSNFC